MENNSDINICDPNILGPSLAEQVRRDLKLSSESDYQVLIAIAESIDEMEIVLRKVRSGGLMMAEKDKVSIASRKASTLSSFYDLLQKRKERKNSQSVVKILSVVLVKLREILRNTPGMADDLVNQIIDSLKVGIMEEISRDKPKAKN